MPRKKLTDEQQRTVARIEAMRDGFARRSPVIPHIEDEADWNRHHRGLRKSFNPQGYYQEFLVRRLATLYWDMDRLTAYQVAATMKNIAVHTFAMGITANRLSGTDEIVDPDPFEVEERQQATLLPDRKDLEVIMRNSNSLHRQSIQIVNQIIVAQARARGDNVPIAMVDVIGPPPSYGPFRSTIPRLRRSPADSSQENGNSPSERAS
jgi:hypothetical protein